MENEAMDSKKISKSVQVTLKTVADYVGHTPGTISAVLNNTAGRDSHTARHEGPHRCRHPRVELPT